MMSTNLFVISNIKHILHIYYGEFILSRSNPFIICKFKYNLLYFSNPKERHQYPDNMEHLICILSVESKVWDCVLGR